MPFVTERWLGGMLTNFATIRKSIKKMQTIDRMLQDGTASNMTKKEILTLTRERNKLEKILGGIANLNRIPHAVFVVDIVHEHLAIKEAHKLGLRTFGMVDTNSDPGQVHFPIPANDDASKSIELIVNYATSVIKEGLEERRKSNDAEEAAAK
jgi:small subunit ribosomal protein S2